MQWDRVAKAGDGRKGQEEIWGSNEYVHYLDCGNDFTGVHVKTYQIVYFEYVHFIVNQTTLIKGFKMKVNGEQNSPVLHLSNLCPVVYTSASKALRKALDYYKGKEIKIINISA